MMVTLMIQMDVQETVFNYNSSIVIIESDFLQSVSKLFSHQFVETVIYKTTNNVMMEINNQTMDVPANVNYSLDLHVLELDNLA